MVEGELERRQDAQRPDGEGDRGGGGERQRTDAASGAATASIVASVARITMHIGGVEVPPSPTIQAAMKPSGMRPLAAASRRQAGAAIEVHRVREERGAEEGAVPLGEVQRQPAAGAEQDRRRGSTTAR